MLLLLAVTCLHGLHDHILVIATDMTLQEGNAIYNTSIEYDPLTADVITYVPYHQRDGLEFLESTKIKNISRSPSGGSLGTSSATTEL